jgi:hypothetical protein
MADERNPAEETGGGKAPANRDGAAGPDSTAPFDPVTGGDAVPGDATAVVPPGGSATAATTPSGAATAPVEPVDATRQVDTPRWSGSAAVPSPDDSDLNYPEPQAPAREPEPDTWPAGEDQRSRATPAVIVLVVVVLLAMLGTGLWLIFSSQEDNSPPGTGPIQPTASAQPSTGTPAPTATTPARPPPTVAPTAQPAPPVPTTTPPATPAQVTVPDVVTRSEAAARQQLTALGLTVQVSRRVVPSVPPGTVIATEPGAGSIVDKGTSVTLIVAAAASPTPTPPTAAASGTAR